MEDGVEIGAAIVIAGDWNARIGGRGECMLESEKEGRKVKRHEDIRR